MFIYDIPVRFRYNRTREMFAYLIDRKGALCALPEIGAVLWPDEEENHLSYVSSMRTDMLDAFSQKHCGDIFVRQRGSIGILTDKVECDYYNWLRDPEDKRCVYRGEYMSQYSWAEETNAAIQFGRKDYGWS